jgi:hypothetical protein
VDSIAERLVSRIQTNPDDSEAYNALKAYYGESGDLASLTNLIAGWAAFQSDPSVAARGYLEAARVVATTGRHEARRLELLREAVGRDPQEREAVIDLVSCLDTAGDTHALAEFLDQHLRRMEEKPTARDLMAALYARLGVLWGSTFERADVARGCFERALELDAANAVVVEGARDLAKQLSDASFLARVCGFEASATPEPERKLVLYLEQAALYQGAAADLDGAVQALRAALQLAPNDPDIMSRLSKLLRKRAETLEGEDAARDQRRAAELQYQLAQTVNPDAALPHLELALTALPSHEAALQMLEQLAPAQGRNDLLPKYWLGYLAHAPEGPELDRRRVSMARIYEQAGQLDDAIACLEQVQSQAQVAQQLSDLRTRRGPRLSGSAPRLPVQPGAAGESDTASPSARQPRPRSASVERPLDIAPRLSELRRGVRDAIAARRQEDAVALCREILELQPGDAEAFGLLESWYRKTQDHVRLRELLLASTQIAGLSIDLRQQRLREVAVLCETKLKDIEGAIEVWRSVVALDPSDVEANRNWKRLLQRTGRWDELALVLERQAVVSQDPAEKAELLAQIAALHRDKRDDPHEAAEALRQLLALRPSAATRDELCELLLSLERYADAVPLLRERAAEAEGEREQLRLLRLLAETLEEKLRDPEAAYDTHLAILKLRPKDPEALQRMQRIDEHSGHSARLLETLERKAAVSARGERAAVLIYMAHVAEQRLDDVDRASAYYRQALELEPGREGVLEALSQLLESRGRHAELSELLAQTAQAERDPERRTQILLRQARVLRGPLARPFDAAGVYRDVLAHADEPEALAFLLESAREDGDPEGIAEWSARLAAISDDPATRRDLLYERAQVLVAELGLTREAIRTLRDIVERVDPDYTPAIDWLAELAGNIGDQAGLASALMRRLHNSTSDQARIALAKRIADLYENELNEPEAAVSALTAWAAADPSDVTPRRRLRLRLEPLNRPDELLETYDALALLESESTDRERATMDAATLAFSQLRDVDGAWLRLQSLVERGVPEALQLLRSIARSAGRSTALAALCVRAAQAATSGKIQGRLWAEATRLYAEDLTDPAQALEAALRLLATDLKSRESLTLVEDTAAQGGQWGRLVPVYERLLKAAETDAERIELLTRHADLLEQRAQNPSEALQRVLQASAVAPADEALIARAERLAARSGRGAELLAACEHQAEAAAHPEQRVEWLLRAARFAVSAEADPARGAAYLEAALAASEAEGALWELCVRAAVQLDDGSAMEGETQPMLRGLVTSHRRIAERSPGGIGAQLILRASRLLADRFADEPGAFELLRQGSNLFPLDETLYDVLLERAEALKRLDALDAHLSRAVDEALDPLSAASLLARRARLLEGPLARPDDAADVYAKLMQLRPDDGHAASKLRDSLRRARRFQDLLLVIHKQLQRVKLPAEKLELLKESAQIWELDLKNRWEALDAYRKVLEFAPGDAEAQRAVMRLERRSGPPPTNGSRDFSSTPPRRSDVPTPSAADETALARPTAGADTVTISAATRADTHAIPAATRADTHAEQTPSAADRADTVAAEQTPNASPAGAPAPALPPLAAESRPGTSASAEDSIPVIDLASSELTTIDEASLSMIEEAAVASRRSRTSTPPPMPPDALRRASAAPGQRGSVIPPVPSSRPNAGPERSSMPPIPPPRKS